MNAKEMKENASAMTEEMRQQAANVKEKAAEWSHKVKDTARDAGAAADLYVHEYAWTTLVLIAAAAGVVGFLIGRSQKSL